MGSSSYGEGGKHRPPPQRRPAPSTPSTSPRGSARQGSAKTAETPAGRPARPRSRRIALGLAGVVVAGAWVALGVLVARVGRVTAAMIRGAFAEDWRHHGLELSVEANGRPARPGGSYKWCSDDPAPPCDAMVEDRIVSGGSATLSFEREDGSTAIGRVVSSNDERVFARGPEVRLTLLPYDMATLTHLGYDTTLCGPDYADLAPKSLLRSLSSLRAGGDARNGRE